MKNFAISIFILFWSTCFQAQDGLKVYINDAVSNTTIKGARVVLEALGLQDVKAVYNSRLNCYYFAEIPKHYTTVMVYHKDYNPKGFCTDGEFPGQLNFQLYDALNVSFAFTEYPDEDRYYKNNDDEVTIRNTGQFRDIYVEDPYKIIIRSLKQGSYMTVRDTIFKLADSMGLDIVPVNPHNPDTGVPYPDCALRAHNYSSGRIDRDKIDDPCLFLPTITGKALIEALFEFGDTYEIVYIFVKKDREPFKRFNDPIIRKLITIEGLSVSGIVYEKLTYRGKERYKASAFKKLDWLYNASQKNKKLRDQFLINGIPIIRIYKNKYDLKKFNDEINGFLSVSMPGEHEEGEYQSVSFSKKLYGLGVLDMNERGKGETFDAPECEASLLDFYKKFLHEGRWKREAFWKSEEYEEYLKNFNR